MQKTFLSVVIPAYKEVDNIQTGVLQDVYNYLKKQTYTWEVLIVDDGSPDNTVEVAKKAVQSFENFKVIKEPHRGKGGTVISGVLKAKGEIVLFTDMDQATPIYEIEKILPKFEEGFDIVIGSRLKRKGAPLTRKIMAYGFIILRTLILRLPYRDTQCGFKAIKQGSSQELFGKMKVFGEKTSKDAGVTAGFDLEMLYLARKMKMKVAEVPVEWEHKGTVRVNPLKDSYQGLRDLIKVRINALKGVYK